MKNREKVLVTGATGFVGRSLCQALIKEGYAVRACIRSYTQSKQLRENVSDPSLLSFYICPALETFNAWHLLLKDMDYIIHLAARVHVINDNSTEPLKAFRAVNVDVTKRLVEAAALTNIKRFIFMSSIKIHGEINAVPFVETSSANPEDPYAISKWEAEKVIQEVGKRTGLDFVIIRPPLVYGKQARANFQQLIHWIKKGYPLPLGNIQNQRSFIYIDNLIYGIINVLKAPVAKQQTYLIDDGKAVSTTELIESISKALGKSVKLFSLPKPLIFFLGKILGQKSKLEKLMGSLVINSNKLQNDLNWKPPYNLVDALTKEFSEEVI
ncbi:MAG: NAD-dependent epimerase/dehydratase family protein [Gammaproteobacteria bacterium]